jgi:hypothetical protein
VINEEIDELIASDEQLTHEFEIGTSVPGIARITLAISFVLPMSLKIIQAESN